LTGGEARSTDEPSSAHTSGARLGELHPQA
jgi:hypothetical protein